MATYTTLRIGSTGDEVKKLQASLGIKDDGIYGNQTAAAVKEYQKANGLSVDGIAGNQTLGKLYGGSTTTAPTTPTTQSQQDTSFKHEDYAKSDIVKQAEALLQQQIANKPGEYQSNWQAQLDETLDKILNREKFSYDLNGDALYQQYKDQYKTQGQLASMDVMGQAAAMNGGYGSSYGDTVGHQAYQGYLQQLNDRVPELYQLALNQYNQEKQDLKDQAALYYDLVQRDHDLYREDVSDYYTDLDYYTGRADKLSDDAYTKWSDKVGMDYNLYSDEQERIAADKADANELAFSMLSMGLTPQAELLAKAGISSEDAKAIVDKVKANEAAAQAAASAKGSEGSISKQGGSADSDFIRFTYSSKDDDKGTSTFYRDGKQYTFERGVNPYTGTKNADVKNGTFSNGYQPNNIGGKKLKAQAEYEVYVNGIRQSVWSYDGGKTLWAWDGSINDYIDVTSKKDELKK